MTDHHPNIVNLLQLNAIQPFPLNSRWDIYTIRWLTLQFGRARSSWYSVCLYLSLLYLKLFSINQSLQKWLKNNTSHANLAFGDIDINEPNDKISDAFDDFWQGVEKQTKDNLD
ncbi:uncharacterized protein BDCG_03989 [Blastomyces dermatitidis ER-3]|uniref:Uncharacterized protein n=1 Tax=Ajellomyces dermatitidis (strain ER-3 / ATCC MYA-2586) TaxID=559297 RepID=A0ABP2EXJ7_AJEDR|nr:uncharacterized protein BDCG_03989 [Blastomyces dermatitidis ER-3]EEQ88869.1 hypothetical protein BDCG_03989 [Blastomyces dermatitidis ER-3]